MVEYSFYPDKEDIINLVTGVLVVTFSYSALYHQFKLKEMSYFLLLSFLVVSTREIGLRTISNWMDGYVDTQLSRTGSILSVFTAFLAVITHLPLIVVLPLANTFTQKKREQWGKEIDSPWMKRQYWVRMVGIASLIIVAILALALNLIRPAQAFLIYSFFQLLPIDGEGKQVKNLDGAFILRWSGFVWLLFMGATLVLLTLTI